MNDLDCLSKPKANQYRCDECHQLQCANNRSRHAKKCAPAYLLSQIQNILRENRKSAPGVDNDDSAQSKDLTTRGLCD